MKRIQRLERAPAGLADYLEIEREFPSWEGFRSHRDGGAHRELSEALTETQRGLCGYCEIALRRDDRQVEHVVPQSDPARGRALSLDAANLIACCLGGTTKGGNGERRGDPKRENRSCGQAKGGIADPSFLDPREVPALPSLTRVEPDGLIFADEAACGASGFESGRVERTVEILGLNVDRLRRARRRRWESLDRRWRSYRDDEEVMTAAASEELLSRLPETPKFFTTVRSFFGPSAESVLSEAPEDWV